MTVTEYAALHKVSDRTVYRWIESGNIKAEKRQGIWFVLGKNGDISDNKTEAFVENGDTVDTEPLDFQQRLGEMREEIEYLRQELTQANQALVDMQQRYDEAQNRHDENQQQSNMIIMQLTKQLDQKTLALEDRRNRSVWTRLKTAFSFSR